MQKRLWGRFAAEIRDPFKKTRVWLGTFDSAAHSLRGSMAKNNFSLLPLPPLRTPDIITNSNDHRPRVRRRRLWP
ncbi:hypothetical protein RHMOL_Rhmol08G0128700 [Rhododendron molle]|uniref:Uncharacterized protein n=1 Tax=Rhododendron molle TaxID=49168 RepID=A0ACC0MMX9_RHOML|nr:hypothetical protein RHMOL_Rhmol08G0128700 [Rhododendron molle]